jgi:hypothetical protein
MENGFDFERLLGFNVEENDRSLRVDGDEKRFAQGEGVAGIEDGGGFRANRESTGKSFGREDAAFG